MLSSTLRQQFRCQREVEQAEKTTSDHLVNWSIVKKKYCSFGIKINLKSIFKRYIRTVGSCVYFFQF